MAERNFFFHFASQEREADGTPTYWRVDLLRMPAVEGREWVEVTAGETPFVIEWEEGDKMTPVATSGATLQLWSDSNFKFKELFVDGYGEVLVRLFQTDKNGENWVIKWSGWLQPMTYRERLSGAAAVAEGEPYRGGYLVEFCAGDLDILRTKKFLEEDGKTHYKGLKSFYDVILLCLRKAYPNHLFGADGFEEHFTIRNSKMAGFWLSKLRINLENFYDEDGVPMTCMEVLESMLRPLCATLIKIHDPAHEGKPYYVVSDLGWLAKTTDSRFVPATTLLEMTDARHARTGTASTEGDYTIEPSYNNLQVTLSRYASAEKYNFTIDESYKDWYKDRDTGARMVWVWATGATDDIINLGDVSGLQGYRDDGGIVHKWVAYWKNDGPKTDFHGEKYGLLVRRAGVTPGGGDIPGDPPRVPNDTWPLKFSFLPANYYLIGSEEEQIKVEVDILLWGIRYRILKNKKESIFHINGGDEQGAGGARVDGNIVLVDMSGNVAFHYVRGISDWRGWQPGAPSGNRVTVWFTSASNGLNYGDEFKDNGGCFNRHYKLCWYQDRNTRDSFSFPIRAKESIGLIDGSIYKLELRFDQAMVWFAEGRGDRQPFYGIVFNNIIVSAAAKFNWELATQDMEKNSVLNPKATDDFEGLTLKCVSEYYPEEGQALGLGNIMQDTSSGFLTGKYFNHTYPPLLPSSGSYSLEELLCAMYHTNYGHSYASFQCAVHGNRWLMRNRVKYGKYTMEGHQGENILPNLAAVGGTAHKYLVKGCRLDVRAGITTLSCVGFTENVHNVEID